MIRDENGTTTDKGINMRRFVTAGAVTALVLIFWDCGGIGYSSGSGVYPSSPTPSSPVVTINVVAIDGAQSFSLNPAALSAGQMIVWHTVNTTTHRVVLDGAVDTGYLAAGVSHQNLPREMRTNCACHG